MPYEHIEQIADRSEERFALGLGARNVAGIVAAGFPMIVVSGGWPPLLRIPAVLAALLLGLLATIDYNGLPLYAWPLWWARGRVRRLIQGPVVVPQQLPGIAQPRIGVPRRVDGPLRSARRAAPAIPAAPGMPGERDAALQVIERR